MKVLFVAGNPKPERWTLPIKQLLPEAKCHRGDNNLESVTAYAGADRLSDFLGSTRVLVNTLPLTGETRDIHSQKHKLGRHHKQAPEHH